MRRGNHWQDIAFAVAGAALTLFGIAATVFQPEAIALVLLGLGALAVPLGAHLPGFNGPKPHPKGQGFDAGIVIEGYKVSLTTARIGLAALVAAAVGYLLAIEIRALNLVFLAIFAAILYWLIFRAGGLYKLDVRREGLWWQTGGRRRLVAWDEIAQATLANSLEGPLLQTPSAALALDAFHVDHAKFADTLHTFANDPELRDHGINPRVFVESLGLEYSFSPTDSQV